MTQTHEPQEQACPQCGSKQVKRLLYGFVDVSLFLELNGQEPDFELGGLSKRAADWRCPQCHHEWQGHPAAPSGAGPRGR